MTYKAIVVFDGPGVKEVILVPENAVRSVIDAISGKISEATAVCFDTIVCKSAKDLESKSVLFKG